MVEIVRNYLTRKGIDFYEKGGRIWILCPFHRETRPSCQFNTQGLWFCFGCHAGGNFSDFVAKIEGVSRRKAWEILRDYGFRAWDAEKKDKGREKEDVDFLRRVYESSIDCFLPKFLEARGITHADMTKFGIRICMDSVWVKNMNLYGWMVLPLKNENLEFAGIVARKLSFTDKKFFASTKDYCWGLEFLQGRRYVILVEGVFDAIFLLKNGLNALATLGTKLSEAQFREILDLNFEKVWVFFDPDAQRVARRLKVSFELCGIKCGSVFSDSDPDEIGGEKARWLKERIESEEVSGSVSEIIV